MLCFELDDADRYLYHYTTASAALGNILPTGLIRFGLARYTNDPREKKAWRFSLSGGSGSNIVEINKAATAHLQHTAKLLCLTRDDPDRALGEDPEAVFGRGFGHSSMWDRYAAAHSGVCLVFDRARLHAQIQHTFPKGNLFAGEVTYEDYARDEIYAFNLDGDDIEARSLEAVLDDHFEKWHRLLFFRKNFDWASEFEFRWLLKSPTPAPEFVPIGNSLCGIVVGEHFSSGDHDSLRHLADQFDAKIATCRWGSGYPDVYPWMDTKGPVINMRARLPGPNPPDPPPSFRIPPKS